VVVGAEELFANGWLRDMLRMRQQYASDAVDNWDPEQLLATAEADIVEYLLAEYAVACPVLHRERIEQLPVSEEIQRVRGFFSGRIYQVHKSKIVIVVPFDGEMEVFNLHPSHSGYSSTPQGLVRDGELLLTWAGGAQAEGDSDTIRRYFDHRLDKIEKRLSRARRDIDWHSRRLRALVTSAVAERKADLLTNRKVEAGMGFPVRQREDASQYAVPVARRKIDTPGRPTATGLFQPEPVLPEAQYEQALAVLRNARNALERTPSMTSNLDEEKIRDLLLVFLNAQFEGAAAGEVFNAAGKTDILVRADDRNVFIAECKIWNGPKTIRDALKQLLSYLTWRDTKAALLVFIRSGEPTVIISKTISEIKGHPNYKRTPRAGEDGERYDFVLHANEDPSREIRLAFLPFALQDIPGQQRRANAEAAGRPGRRFVTSARRQTAGS
jgi:hypothetical protein